MTRSILFLILLNLVTCSLSSASDFYDASQETSTVYVNAVTDFNVDANDLLDDTPKLQQAVDYLSNVGGGVLTIPAGIYLLNDLHLKSNVHIYIDHHAQLMPYFEQPHKATTLIVIGADQQAQVKNVSIRGINGRFSVKIPDNTAGVRFIRLSHVTNFFLSDFNIQAANTKYSGIIFTPIGNQPDDGGFAHKGTVQNASIFNAHYGYGLVQTHAAESVLFDNLHAQGGVVLRIETGEKKMNDNQFGGVNNIYATNISAKNCKTAVMLSPHSMHNGTVHIDGVNTENCSMGVYVGAGFISNKQKNENLTNGSFSKDSSITNVNAIFGFNAPTKYKDFKYVPKELKVYIQDEHIMDEGAFAPSIAAVMYLAPYPVKISNVTAVKFKYVPDIFDKEFYSSVDKL